MYAKKTVPVFKNVYCGLDTAVKYCHFNGIFRYFYRNKNQRPKIIVLRGSVVLIIACGLNSAQHTVTEQIPPFSEISTQTRTESNGSGNQTINCGLIRQKNTGCGNGTNNKMFTYFY